MATTTTRLALRKPDPTPITGDVVNAALDLNANWDKVDGALGAIACTSGARPGSPFNGMFARETDTGNLILCTNTVGPVWTRVFIDAQAAWSGAISLANVASVVRAASSDPVLQAQVTSDTQQRFLLSADGKILIGSGSATGDTNLYRSAADTLKTDDSFVVGGTLAVTGASTFTGTITSPNTLWVARTTIAATGSTSFSVTVPATLRRLSVRWRARSFSGAAPCTLSYTINNDTNTRYHWEGWNVNGFAHTGAEQVGTTQAAGLLGSFSGSGSTAGLYGTGQCEFYPWDGIGSVSHLGSQATWVTAEFGTVKLSGNHNGFYTGPATYTSIQIKATGGDFGIGSDFQFEGVYA